NAVVLRRIGGVAALSRGASYLRIADADFNGSTRARSGRLESLLEAFCQHARNPKSFVTGDVWLEHNVTFFRDQDLPPSKFLAFAKRFVRWSNIPSSRVSKAFRSNRHNLKCWPFFDDLPSVRRQLDESCRQIVNQHPFCGRNEADAILVVILLVFEYDRPLAVGVPELRFLSSMQR